MRNLKRVLSLTLASVMLLGMMVVGSSAAAGFPDVDENDNIEAIEVLQAVEVMVGDDRGFGPDRPVTRNEMAVVMGKLLNLDYNYYTSTCPFNDVANWARGWVGACYANGIVSGRGEGVYDGESTVTAVEAASMMMRALGYFKYQNDYADGFQVSTVRQGTKIGIFDMVGTDATTPMTRNQVAQMALNALQSGMVEPDGNTINLTTPDGSVFTGKVNYVYRTSAKPFARAISPTQATAIGSQNGGTIVELGEQLYNGDLKLYDDRTDEFGRPARQWEYKGNKVGTYAKKELQRAEYTTEVTGLTLYDLLGNDVVKANSEWDIFVYIDGENRYSATNQNGVATMFDRSELNKNNKAKVGGTGNGVLTEVYVDADSKEVTIAIVNTYLAVAKADYNEKKDELTFEVHAINKDSNNNYFKVLKACENDDEDKKDMTITGEDFPVAKDIKESDVYLVNVAQGEIQVVSSPELLDNTVLTAFKKYDWVETDGTKYKYASTAEFKYNELDKYTGSNNNDTINLKDQTYKVYLDSYGYLIGIELIEAVKNYVFITGINTKDNYLAARSHEANAIFLDGTMQTITYNVEKSDNIINADDPALTNTWCTYTVNNTGVYTLKQVVGPDGNDDSQVDRDSNGIKVGQYHDILSTDIDVKHVSLRGGNGPRSEFKYVYGNDDTVYLNAKVKTVKVTGTTNGQGIISDVASVTTGINDASLKIQDNNGAAELAKSNSVVPKKLPDGTAGAYEVAQGAYVLYNKDGYIIAAVTVAKDSASTKNLVYVNSSKAEEHYSSANDEWTWYREVVYNGEKVDLKEVGDGISIVENLKQHNWYVVSYNAKGEVISATHAYDELDHNNEYAMEIDHLEGTINAAGADTVLYEESLYNGMNGSGIVTCPDEITNGTKLDGDASHSANAAHAKNAVHDAKGPNLKASTFYVRTEDKTGFYVDDDVKAVFIQTNRNGETTEIETGKTALKNFIDDLNEYGEEYVSCVCGEGHQTKFCYEVSAVITGGRAKVVIIRDLHTQGDGGDKPTGDTDGLYVDASVPNNVTIEFVNNDPSAALEDNNGIAAIIEELEGNLGYLVEKVDWNSTDGTYDFSATKEVNGRKITVVYKWDPSSTTVQYSINVTGKGTYRIDASSLTDWDSVITAINAAYTSASLTAGDYVKVTGQTNPVAHDASTGVANNATVDLGYYKLAVTQGVTGNTTNLNGATATATLTSAEYVKKADTDVTVKISLDKATSNTGIKLSLTAPAANASIKGNGVIKADAAGDFEVTVALKAAAIATGSDTTITFSEADAPDLFKIKVNGVEKEVAVGDTIHSAIDGVPANANSFALFNSATSGNVTPANATNAIAGNGTFVKADHQGKNFAAEEYVEVDDTATVTGFGVKLTYDKGTDTNKNLISVTVGAGTKKLAPVGATVKMTLTADATQSAKGNRTAVTKQFSLTSATATDKLKYNGTSTVLPTDEQTEKIQSTVTATGAAVDVIKANDTVTVTFNAKTATTTKYTPSVITPVAYADDGT